MRKIFFLTIFNFFYLVLVGQSDINGIGSGVYFLPANGNVIEVKNNVQVNFSRNVLIDSNLFTSADIETNKVNFTKDDTNLCFSFVISINLIDVLPYDSPDVTENSKTNISQIIVVPFSTFEDEWQNNKSVGLKMIENTYVDFLTNDWTPMLRNNSLISQDHTITIDNTDEQANIIYLLQLRSIDRNNYYIAAGEFSRFKDNILKLGGIMSKVKVHQLN